MISIIDTFILFPFISFSINAKIKEAASVDKQCTLLGIHMEKCISVQMIELSFSACTLPCFKANFLPFFTET